MSLLKIPLQLLKMTFFCSSARYLPQVFPCREGYSARETIFLLNKPKKMPSGSSGSRGEGGPTAPRSFQLPPPTGNETPVAGGTVKLQRASK